MSIDLRQSRISRLERYVSLIEKALAKEISLEQFEKGYFKLFKADDTAWSDLEFDTLNGLFTDLDCHSSDPDLWGPEDFDDNEIIERLTLALERLKSLLRAQNVQ